MNNTQVVEKPQTSQIAQVAELPKWNLDATHTSAGFAVRHLMISNIKGEFREMSGELRYDPLSIEDASIETTIQVASIETREGNRDAHLKSADFFDAEKYPTITFRSTKWEHKSDDELLITGDLTIRGITRPVALAIEATPVVQDTWGGSRVGFSGKTKINRKDFGLTWNVALEAGGVVVGEDVTITLEAEFVKQ